MSKLLNRHGIAKDLDNHDILPKDFTSETGDVSGILPIDSWLAHCDQFDPETIPGVWMDGDAEPAQLSGHYQKLQCLAINFPAFMDGRGFSLARIIRDQYNYTGELRAFGQIIPDQYFFLFRCGFDSLVVDERYADIDLSAFQRPFSVCYQSSSNEPRPLFRRRA